jgi:hypothetical protein
MRKKRENPFAVELKMMVISLKYGTIWNNFFIWFVG